MIGFTTCGYGTNTIDNFTNISGIGSNYQPYQFFSGGGKKKAEKKAKKTKKSKKRTPLRKPIPKKTKRMARMRMKSVKNVEKRRRKLSKRLKHRKARTKVIDSLASNTPLNKKDLRSLSPAMAKFVSKIPKDKSGSSKLTSWPSFNSMSDISLQSIKPPPGFKGKSISDRQKKFEDARIGLAEILKKKPPYPVKSKSIVKFSDFKKQMTKEKAALMFKNKKKGKSR